MSGWNDPPKYKSFPTPERLYHGSLIGYEVIQTSRVEAIVSQPGTSTPVDGAGLKFAYEKNMLTVCWCGSKFFPTDNKMVKAGIAPVCGYANCKPI